MPELSYVRAMDGTKYSVHFTNVSYAMETIGCLMSLYRDVEAAEIEAEVSLLGRNGAAGLAYLMDIIAASVEELAAMQGVGKD